VIQACPLASVAIICRVDAVQAAKRVTIPAQKQALDGRYLGGIVRYLIQ